MRTLSRARTAGPRITLAAKTGNTCLRKFNTAALFLPLQHWSHAVTNPRASTRRARIARARVRLARARSHAVARNLCGTRFCSLLRDMGLAPVLRGSRRRSSQPAPPAIRTSTHRRPARCGAMPGARPAAGSIAGTGNACDAAKSAAKLAVLRPAGAGVSRAERQRRREPQAAWGQEGKALKTTRLDAHLRKERALRRHRPPPGAEVHRAFTKYSARWKPVKGPRTYGSTVDDVPPRCRRPVM